jgi:hypothetical protein
MDEEKRPGEASAPPVADELRQLGQSFSALGRTMFKEGRTLSVELLRSVRGVVDRAREEIERLAGDKK